MLRAFLLLLSFCLAYLARAEDAGMIERMPDQDLVTEVSLTDTSGMKSCLLPCMVRVENQITNTSTESVQFNLKDGTEMILGPGAQLSFEHGDESTGSPRWNPVLGAGLVSVAVPVPPAPEIAVAQKELAPLHYRFMIRTPTAVLGVRGTQFVVEAAELGTEVHTLEGEVAFSHSRAELFTPGKFVSIRMNQTSRFRKGGLSPSAPRLFRRERLRERLQKSGLKSARIFSARAHPNAGEGTSSISLPAKSLGIKHRRKKHR